MTYYYLDGELLRNDQCAMKPSTHAMNYGTAAIEGMRALWDDNENRWYLLRPDRHFARLKRGTDMLSMNWNVDFEQFVAALNKVIAKNGIREDLYLRPMIYHAAEGVGLTKTDEVRFAIHVEPMPVAQPAPRTAGLVSQRRPVDGSYAVKIAGNYVLSFLAQAEAKRNGFDVGILLSTDGYLSEASVMNLFWTKDDDLFTPSLACGPLDGVTRDCVIHIARGELNVTVHEGTYRPNILAAADEIFLCGSGTGIAAVSRFGDRSLTTPDDSLCDRLWSQYYHIARNRPSEYSDWFLAIDR